MTNIARLDVLKSSEEVGRLDEFLKSKIIGQRLAIERIIRRYEQYLSPLKRKNKPIGAFIFLGPSGVGKTRIAQALAEFFFESEKALTKVHCPNFQNGHEVSTLIGSPPGYIGYYSPTERPGHTPPVFSQESIDQPAMDYLVDKFERENSRIKNLRARMEKIREELRILDSDESMSEKDKVPEMRMLSMRIAIYESEIETEVNNFLRKTRLISILLLDEIEKSHSALKNVLLGLTDSGEAYLTNGTITNFTNSFVIMTSNVGSEEIAKTISGGRSVADVLTFSDTHRKKSEEIYREAMRVLRLEFSPEFLGRLEQDVVVFHPLSKDEKNKVLKIRFKELFGELARIFPLELIIGEEVFEFIMEKASDHPEYGARLIEDKIDKYFKEPLSALMNTGQVKVGDKVFVKLEKKNGERKIIFEKESS